MPVPEFNEMKAPALQFFAGGNPHRISEVYLVLARHFKLTEEEQNEILPSGTQRRWHNRANWACYDLFRAGLLDRPKRGLYVITEAGKKVAEQNPKLIDRDFLMQFPQFVRFAPPSVSKAKNLRPPVVEHAAFVVRRSRRAILRDSVRRRQSRAPADGRPGGYLLKRKCARS